MKEVPSTTEEENEKGKKEALTISKN